MSSLVETLSPTKLVKVLIAVPSIRRDYHNMTKHAAFLYGGPTLFLAVRVARFGLPKVLSRPMLLFFDIVGQGSIGGHWSDGGGEEYVDASGVKRGNFI